MPTIKHPADPDALYNLFEDAVKAMPLKNVSSTLDRYGNIFITDDSDINYREEYTFTAGAIKAKPLEGGGWVELRRNNGQVHISAHFRVARNGDWTDEEALLLPPNHAILGQYDQADKSWEFWIDAY
ncbi:hypothetical protein ACFLYO_04900 [Chloroflexota bacterium]